MELGIHKLDIHGVRNTFKNCVGSLKPRMLVLGSFFLSLNYLD